jgi:hypothetical protein
VELELRNGEKTIRAAKYAEEQLIDVLSDSRTLSPTGMTIVQQILHLVQSIGFGQDNVTVWEKFYAVIEHVTTVTPHAKPNKPSSNDEITPIEVEIARRAKIRSQIVSIQEQLENERDQKQRDLETVAELLKRGLDEEAQTKRRSVIETELLPLDETIKQIIVAVADNDRKVAALTAYRSAVLLVKHGPPEGVIGGEFKLPV